MLRPRHSSSVDVFCLFIEVFFCSVPTFLVTCHGIESLETLNCKRLVSLTRNVFPVCCPGYCDSGYQKMDNGTCIICPIGFYKDNSIDNFHECTRCADPRFVTPSAGSTSQAQCTVCEWWPTAACTVQSVCRLVWVVVSFVCCFPALVNFVVSLICGGIT